MGEVKMYDPQAAPLLAAATDAAVAKVARLLKRQAARADALREVAAAEGNEKAWKQAEAADKDVLAVVELIQAFRALLQQQAHDNASAWAMVELQDKRATGLKRQTLESMQEVRRQMRQFDQLHAAFEAYVANNQLKNAA